MVYVYIEGGFEEAVVVIVVVGYLIMIPGQRLLLGKAREGVRQLAAMKQQRVRRPLHQR